MKTALRQLRLIVWKNFLSRKRQKIRFLFEIIWPLFLFLLLMWVRTRGLRENVQECNVSEKVLPTAGFLPFVQNWFCTVNNTCFATAEEAKIPPANLTLSRLREMAREIQDLYMNKTGGDGVNTLPSLFDAVLDSTRMATLSRKLSSPNYKSVPTRLESFLTDLKTIPAELSANKVDLNKQEQLALFGSNLSSATYHYGPFVLLLNDSSSVECDNISVNLTEMDQIINKRLCKFKSEETRSFRQVMNRHWNSSINKELVEDYLRYNMEETVSFEDMMEANKVYSNLTESSQALNSAGDAFGPDGSSSAMMLAADPHTIEQFFNIINKYLCGRTVSLNDSILPDTKLRIEEFKEKYRLKQITHYVYDNQSSKMCNNFFQSMEVNPVTRLFWKSYKHLILGKIIYTPVTPMTNRIMKKLNDTYFQLQVIRKLVDSVQKNTAFPASVFLRGAADSLNTSRRFLNSSTAYSLFPRYNYVNSTDEVLSNLEKGEEVFRSVLEARDANGGENESLWDCFDYDRVIGVDDPQDAVTMAESFMEFNRLWALVVFDSEYKDVDLNKTGTNKNRTKRATNSILSTSPRKQLVKDSAPIKNTTKPANSSQKSRQNEQLTNPKTVYRIRMSSEFVDNTEAIRDRLERQGGRFRPMVDLKYITYGFAYLQDIIEKCIISDQTGVAVDDLPGTMFQQYPYPCYIEDQFIKAISRMFPLFMVLAWIFTCSMIVKSIVYEKELRLKQTMQVMGLKNYIFWIGWYIDSILPMLLTIFILTLILTSGGVLIFSDPTVVFTFLFLYSHCTIFLSFLISVFFDRANIAAACAGIIFFILFLPYPFMVRWILYFKPWLKATVSLLSNVALGLGAAYMAEFEEQGIGMQWSNVNKSGIYDDEFNMAYIMIVMVVDCFLYILLTWYIESVNPGQFGIPLPWYFPFTRSYWLGKNYKSSKTKSALSQTPQSNGSVRPPLENDEHFEPDPPMLNPGVQIQDLTKVYRNGKVAVKNLSMNFYEGQITSFLGHNGAGKTTTISILTGLYPPTSGTAIICGYDIRTEISLVRKSLGMCPQHNVLFHRLTVLEHLKFYGFLRGSDEKQVEQEFEQMLMDLDLPDKRHNFPGDLSGGMQRKLSIALAFIGGSKVVILDEPTSGVDPYSRRSIWELLLKYKQGRTVILTTHYMDEADLLGDRIGIISKGTMKCCGTSLFLKNKYGSGFTLTVELKPETPDALPLEAKESTTEDETSHNDEVNSSYNDLPITKTVKKYVPNAVVESKFGNEITFVLPTKDSKKLESLCSRLDDDISRLNAISYGVSDTSLEEIFLRITDDLPEEDQPPKSFIMDLFHKPLKTKSTHEIPDSQVPVRVTSESVEKKTTNKYVRQYFALHFKRFHHTKRDIKALFSELVLPPILVAVALAVLSLAPRLLERPPLELTTAVYGDNLTFFAKDETPGTLSDVMKAYRNSIYDEFGLGTTCLFWNGTESPCEKEAVFTETPDYKIPICSCKTGAQICPDVLDVPPPSHAKIVSGDYVYTMDDLDTSKWITSTTKKYGLNNLGGFEFGKNLSASDEALVTLKRLSEFGLIDPEIAKYLPDRIRPSDNNIKVWFYNKAWIASVANLNALHNNMLRVHAKMTNKTPPWQQYGIVAINHPMRFTLKQLDIERMQQSGFSLLQAISVIFALSFVTASFLLYLIEERISNAKHLQLVSGVNRLVYWIQAYSWDLVAYTLSALLCIFVFLLFDSPAYTSKDSFAGFVLLFFLYGWSCIPMMYPASFIFNVPSSAFVAMGCGNMFIGIITTITTSVLQSFPDEELRSIARVLSEVFLIFPHFCLGDGMIKLSVHYFSKVSLSALDVTIEADVFEWNFLGKNMVCMFALGIIFFLFTLAIEYNVFRAIRHRFKDYIEKTLQKLASRRTKAVIISVSPGFGFFRMPLTRRLLNFRAFSSIYSAYDSLLDRLSLLIAGSLVTNDDVDLDFGIGDEEDVALERKRVYNNPNDLLLIKDLTKKYSRKATPSVNKICIGVKRGECFGLLGLNGAGKTTTFKMLTGAVKPTSGDATVGGYSIKGASINDVRALLGYCPQFDALDPLMTPYEHLVFYARIRNIPSDILPTRVDQLIKRMALGHYRNRLAGDLSGGNKRKLSTGIALLGNPPLVFLDEPTTGMDPKARRFLWTCISEIVKEGGCVILTSHSMEECQALCTRLTIMVNGQFTCLGSSQHLKNKYGKGYLLIIRCAENSKDEVKEFMRQRISSSKITEEHFTQLRYEVPQSRLSDVLKELETAKSRNIVVDYSVTQTTLEEVFLRFAREQADPNDRKQKKPTSLFDCCMGKGYKNDKHVSPKETE